MNKTVLPFHLLIPCTISLIIGLLIVKVSHDLTTPQLLQLDSGFEVFTLINGGDELFPIPSPHKPTYLISAKNLPSDLADLPVHKKSKVFVSLLIPHLLMANQLIFEERRQLDTLWEKKQSFLNLSPKEKRWLRKLGNKYGLQSIDFTELKLRVDTIPLSLALAQAILESGWGTSRFAIQGNALFGIHRSIDTQKAYMSSASGSVKVAAYNSLAESVNCYLNTLNSVQAYEDFRLIRAETRARDMELKGFDLANSLGFYSELGNIYTERVRLLIRQYELGKLDTLSLSGRTKTIPLNFSRKTVSQTL